MPKRQYSITHRANLRDEWGTLAMAVVKRKSALSFSNCAYALAIIAQVVRMLADPNPTYRTIFVVGLLSVVATLVIGVTAQYAGEYLAKKS